MPYDINYFAVLVSAVIYWLIGALWYSPLMFARPWMKAVGKSEEDLRQVKPAPQFVGSFVAMLIMAYVLAHVIHYADARTLAGGLQTGFWCWLGFIATTSAVNGLFENRSRTLFYINNGYTLIGLLIMGTIQALWR